MLFTLVAEQLVEELGQESITPTRPTRRTLALGARHRRSLPVSRLKFAWELIWRLEKGADTIISGAVTGHAGRSLR